MKTRVFVAAALALALIAPAANALTIANAEKASVTVKVLPQGGKEVDLAIKAGANADVDCKKGCQLTLGAEKLSVDGKVAKVTVKAGKFVM